MRAAPMHALAGRLLLAASLAGVVASPAFATLKRNPVQLHAVGPAPVLRPGESATIRFEMRTREEVLVSGVSVESSSLAQPFARRSAPLRARPDAPLQFELAVLPTSTPDPLVIRYEVDGASHEVTVDLTSRLESEMAKRSAMEEVSVASPRAPDPAILAFEDSVRSAHRASRQGGTVIFYSGTLVYTRPGDGGAIPTQDMGAAGVRVSLMDEDYGPDDELGSTFTGPTGYFHASVYWDGQIGEGDPELYIKFETDHPWVVVQEGFWDVEYSWNTSTRASSTADVHIGTYRPSDISTHPALHISTNFARNHLWYQDKAGYFVPGVDVKWPDGDNAYFDPTWEQIHISHAREWNESTHAHEFGHFFVYTFADQHDPSYCNGFCDNNGCGHCLWCPEGSNEAFSEGWADWISRVQTQSYLPDYGLAAVYQYNFESVQTCGQNGVIYADAEITEGNFAAVLQDIWDSGPGTDDMDPNGFGYRDRLELGFDEIFTVLDVDQPQDSRSFMNAFVNRYGQYRGQLWEVAMNNRWNLDGSPPGPPSNLTSTSHPHNTPTPNLRISLSWTQAAPDDWSGVAGYSIAFGSSPQTPDVTLEVGPISSYTSPDLVAGTYYATIRTVDRSGRGSNSYLTAGPYIITTPTPVDVAPYQAPGWARPVVARPTADATASSVPNPLTLTGNTTAYFNASGRNQGQSAHVGFIGIRTSFYIDGRGYNRLGYSHPDDPGATFAILNEGYTVRGGRHAVGAFFDSWDEWWEGNESNNYWVHPWVWSPMGLAPGARVRRMEGPPNPTGGWNGVVDGSPLHYNCDGFNFNSSGFWNAVWVAADSDSEDYAIRLHSSTVFVDVGFDAVLGSSDKPEGYLDAVLVNRNTAGNIGWTVGVVGDLSANYLVSHSPFVVKHVTSSSFPWADTLNVAFPDSDYVVLKEVFVPAAGPVAITVTADTTGGPVHVTWLDRTYLRGGLDAPAWTWPAGKVTLEATATAAGYHCVVLSRDPKDGRGARTVQLGVGTPPVDLEPYVASGWGGAVVPRPTADATGSSASAPDTLHGGVATTYANVAYRNQSLSPTGAVPVGFDLALDGVTLASFSVPALGAYGTASSINRGPYAIPGGRHLVSAKFDPLGRFHEALESNNASGEQWVWSPVTLPLGSGQTGPVPPDPVGGFASFTGSGALFYNCLGYRAVFGAATGLWGGVGLAPVDSSDSDLRLHDPAPGTRDGMGLSLGISSWGPFDSDYLIVRHDGARTLDASVIRGDDGSPGGFDIGATGAAALGALPVSTGDQLMGTSDVLRLHPVVLPTGYIRVRLAHQSGGVDWGLSIHNDSTLVQSRSRASAASWLAGAGQGEEFILQVTAPDTFVVAVWKRGGADRGQFGVYRLQVDAMALDAPGGTTPVATRLTSVRPAPFRDRALLSFDLAAAGEARLEIFDLRGARVRTLAEGRREAGRHDLEWRGEDDSGRRLPPGMYLVRLQAGAFTGQQKVVKVD